jgi:hypothetical protein
MRELRTTEVRKLFAFSSFVGSIRLCPAPTFRRSQASDTLGTTVRKQQSAKGSSDYCEVASLNRGT